MLISGMRNPQHVSLLSTAFVTVESMGSTSFWKQCYIFTFFPPPATSLEIHTRPPLPWSLTSISHKPLGQQSKMDVAHPGVSPKSFPLRTPEVNQSTRLGWAKTHSANIWAQAPRDLEGPAAGRASGSHQPGKLPGAKFIHPGSVTDRCSYSAFSTWLTPLRRMYIHFVGFCII